VDQIKCNLNSYAKVHKFEYAMCIMHVSGAHKWKYISKFCYVINFLYLNYKYALTFKGINGGKFVFFFYYEMNWTCHNLRALLEILVVGYY